MEKNNEELLQHKAKIPFNASDVKRALDLQFQLSEEQRKLYFALVQETIALMNEAGMNVWYPDKVKPLFCTIFAYGYGRSRAIKDSLDGKYPDVLAELPSVFNQDKQNILFPGI